MGEQRKDSPVPLIAGVLVIIFLEVLHGGTFQLVELTKQGPASGRKRDPGNKDPGLGERAQLPGPGECADHHTAADDRLVKKVR